MREALSDKYLHRVEMSSRKSKLISYFWNEDLCYRVTDIRLHYNCLFTCLYFLLHCYNKRTKNWYLFIHLPISVGYLGGSVVKNPPCQCRRLRRLRFHPWVRKIPWSREWQPTAVFLPGEFPKQRSLADYSPWGRKESVTTERLTLSQTLCEVVCGTKWR